MTLKETVEMMLSKDYRDRFRAEYWQTKIRRDKLHAMTLKYKDGTLDFQPKCKLALLLAQKAEMEAYLARLEERAEIEKIDLGERQ